jgi:chitin disaccharide deacetylase
LEHRDIFSMLARKSEISTMNNLTKSQTNRLLGYPADARLLIINAYDFGMCNSINEAIFGTLLEGMVRSTSLMITCPWALQAMNLLSSHRHIPFGVHLTVICDANNFRWGPITSKEKVPDLVDRAGSFYSEEDFPTLLDQGILDQLEVEFRAQIEAVMTAGLRPARLIGIPCISTTGLTCLT